MEDRKITLELSYEETTSLLNILSSYNSRYESDAEIFSKLFPDRQSVISKNSALYHKIGKQFLDRAMRG